ncbi:MAG: hypothetical protein M1816_002303 [Peltula sp. TS41687]|nr:MAG: hypothetical protein M1816_002303 [Peltula sp. TS41687]
MTSNLMDIEPGGESSQYESIKTVTEPHAKAQGQFNGLYTAHNMLPTPIGRQADGCCCEDPDTPGASNAEAQQAEQKTERGEKTAENVRYGDAISEHGMGGETTGLGGGVGTSQDSSAGTKAADQEELDAKKSREVQGYGPGSGVGA